MHYRLVAKTADFTPEELLNKLQGFMPVTNEAVHQYGCWKLARYADFAAFAADDVVYVTDCHNYQPFHKKG